MAKVRELKMRLAVSWSDYQRTKDLFDMNRVESDIAANLACEIGVNALQEADQGCKGSGMA